MYKAANIELARGILTRDHARDTSGLTARQEWNHCAESHTSVVNHTLFLHSVQVAHKAVSKMLCMVLLLSICLANHDSATGSQK